MSPKLLSLSIALAFSSSLALAANNQSTASVVSATASELTLEQVYRAKSYAGQAASQLHFSADGRYLAYLWNPFGENGSDLYLHDTLTGSTSRITSPTLMKSYDAPEDWLRFDKKALQKEQEEAERQAKAEAHAAYLRGEKVDLSLWENAALAGIKQELADKKVKDAAKKAMLAADAAKEKIAMAALGKANKAEAGKADADKKDEKADKSSEDDKAKEIWELRDELKKKLVKEKLKASDLYPGVENLAWAKKANELIFQYRGDLFRLQAATGKIARLTQTDKAERLIGYSAEDQGYLYMDDKRIYSANFENGNLRQLNRELIHPDDADKKYSIKETVLSEDRRWMAISAEAPDVVPDAGKPAPAAERQVEIMNYSERFASAKKVPREVSDDKRKVLASALYIRRVSENNADPKLQAPPVFSNEGGDVWFEMSKVSWAKDASRYTFSTWEREKQLLRIYVGKADENLKPALVFEQRGDIGHEVVNVIAPRFTPDGKSLIAILDQNGYRQPYLIDSDAKDGKGKAQALLKGNFEAHHIIGFSPDSKTMLVLANRDDFAAMNAYSVKLADGSMTALGQAGDFHRSSAIAENGQQLASVAGQWSKRPELQLIKLDTRARSVLTDSHDPQWKNIDVLRPARFSYANRHGDAIEAYVFKPANWQASDLRPAVVYTYGGPLNDRHIVETDSFQATAYLFGMYMAAKHGYVMVAVDPRGHSNYGRKFSDANWEQVGKPQTEDLQDLASYMQKNLGVDAQRIGLTGWSFGGFQTQYTMYTSPDTFAAGIAGAGPTEWENYNSWYSGRTIGKTERSKPTLRRYSLLPLTTGLKKPLMLVHGMQDPNVLYQDTVNVYRALLDNGKEGLVDLFLDPDGEHGLDGVVKAKGRHKKYESFFLQHLGVAK
ncbi:MAG: prolyl oligopeptidase family serine peptidase [Burkholderiales bacterium]|nr:prolyl oligopeptidase family serine peptidase [Burkholderiales bacterium]